MPRLVAACVFAIGIVGLFVLDRDTKSRPSKALWIPVIWLLINGSRPVSAWLNMAPVIDSPSMVLDGSPVDALVYAILLAAGLVVMVVRRRQVSRLLRSNLPIVLFFLYCGISVLWSDYPFVAFKRWTKFIGELVIILLVLSDADPDAAIRVLLKRTGFLLLPVSVLFVKYFPELGRGYSQWDGTRSDVGVTTNKNLLGMICLVLGLGALWRFLQLLGSEKSSTRTRQLISQGALLSTAMWLLWISNSMTSLSCFGLAGSLIVGTSLFDLFRKRVALYGLTMLALGSACAALFLDLGAAVVESMGRDPTLTGRTAIWHLVLSLAENPLFGTGFESFWLGQRLEKVWDIYWFHLNEAHNGYLEVYLNLGWIGIVMLSAIMLIGYRDILSSFQGHSAGVQRARLRIGYIVMAAIYSLTEAGFRMMSPIWISLLLVVVVMPNELMPNTAVEQQLKSWKLPSLKASERKREVAWTTRG